MVSPICTLLGDDEARGLDGPRRRGRSTLSPWSTGHMVDRLEDVYRSVLATGGP